MDKYNSGKPSNFNFTKSFKNIQLGVVTTVGKVQVNTDSEGNRARDVRFNADDHAIRVRIVGSKYDNKVPDTQLANCFPLMPKHLNVVPKVGEICIIFLFGEDEKFGDRWYMGPIISSPDKLKKDTIDGTATANLAEGTTTPAQEISKVPNARGVYEDPQNVVIEGRDNTDIIQRPGEIIIRSGKFIKNNPLQYNSKNPGFIQIKSDMKYTEGEGDTQITREDVTVTNIVSDKINLLGYRDSNPVFGEDGGLTKVDDKGVAQYITDERLQDIIDNAHPLVFGDTLVEYLKLFRRALADHVHNGNGNPATDRTDNPNGLSLKDFVDKAERLEKEMLSKNIRIN